MIAELCSMLPADFVGGADAALDLNHLNSDVGFRCEVLRLVESQQPFVFESGDWHRGEATLARMRPLLLGMAAASEAIAVALADRNAQARRRDTLGSEGKVR